MKRKNDFSNFFACDFETVNYDGCEKTEVWLSGFCELFSKNEPTCYTNLTDFMEYFLKINNKNSVLYFHNEKFDGSFIVDYLLKNGFTFSHKGKKDLNHMEFDTLISDMGRWYLITIKYKTHTVEIRDSLKLLPMSLKQLGKSFKTDHQKLEMDYKVHTAANQFVTPEEKRYFLNDIYVLKECLEFTFSEGHTRLTIGSCCIGEFKSFYTKNEWESFFPDLYETQLDESWFSDKTYTDRMNLGEYIRKGYKGAFCYLKPEYMDTVIKDGRTYDANSLYPSVMHSKSGNPYPVGFPMVLNDWQDFKRIENDDNYLYFIRVKIRFKIKPDYLPTIQIKRNPLYPGTEYLTTSDVKTKESYSPYYISTDGKIELAFPEVTLTKPDYILLLRHYEVLKIEFLDGVYFNTITGLFDPYINKYMEIKEKSKGGKRQLSKLYLNNLYGRFASGKDSSYKKPKLENGKVVYEDVEEYDKDTGYIPIGAYVTAYARYHTITMAQANFEDFIYADTDSIHMKNTEPKKITIHPTHLCAWKLETKWDIAKFVRQKTYIERVVWTENGACRPKMQITCAGMPDRCKQTFEKFCLKGEEIIEVDKDGEEMFHVKHYTLRNFTFGLKIFGKLMPKIVDGGTVLREGYYIMRRKKNFFVESPEVVKEELELLQESYYTKETDDF